jgi:hypothetical protein
MPIPNDSPWAPVPVDPPTFPKLFFSILDVIFNPEDGCSWIL